MKIILTACSLLIATSVSAAPITFWSGGENALGVVDATTESWWVPGIASNVDDRHAMATVVVTSDEAVEYWLAFTLDVRTPYAFHLLYVSRLAEISSRVYLDGLIIVLDTERVASYSTLTQMRVLEPGMHVVKVLMEAHDWTVDPSTPAAVTWLDIHLGEPEAQSFARMAAVDQVAEVPEPATLVLVGLGLLWRRL